jgi:hypothetical protein
MSVRFYRIYGIKGGPKIGSLDPMGGPEDEGLIVSFAPWGDIIYSDEYPVELVVDGYPERRYPEEPDSVVTIALFRRGKTAHGDGKVYEVRVSLHNLAERPTLATKPVYPCDDKGGLR